jgi:hypothetical protein
VKKFVVAVAALLVLAASGMIGVATGRDLDSGAMHNGLSGKPIADDSVQKRKSSTAADNFSIDFDTEEVIFRNLPGIFAGSKEYSFVLQKNVPVKVSAFVPGTPAARVVLESPSGVQTAISNAQPTDFLAQQTIVPAESGQWKIKVTGPAADYDVAIVTRSRGAVAIDAGVSKETVAEGTKNLIYSYLYSRDKAGSTSFQDLPRTVDYKTQSVEASILNANGVRETLILRDDGTGGDAVANDGFYMASYTPASSGQLAIIVKSIRDDGIQLMNDKPFFLTVTAAANSSIQDVSAPTLTKDAYGSYDGIHYTVKANLTKAGKYYMAAVTNGKSGDHLATIYSDAVEILTPGVHEFKIILDREFILDNNKQMPMKIETLFLTYGQKLVDSKEVNIPVPHVDPVGFEEKKAKLKGIQSITLVDADGNGLSDRMDIKYLVFVPIGNRYRVQSSIGEKGGDIISWSNVEFYRNGDDNEITLSFDLRKMKASGLTSFYLSNIMLFGELYDTDPKGYPINIDLDSVDSYKLADLQVKADVYGRFLTQSGQDFAFAVFNGGGVAAQNIPWELRLGPGEQIVLSGVIDQILPGQSVSIKLEAPESVLRTPSLFAHVNPKRSVAEADYSNNFQMSGAAFATAAAPPASGAAPSASGGGATPVPILEKAWTAFLSISMVLLGLFSYWLRPAALKR